MAVSYSFNTTNSLTTYCCKDLRGVSLRRNISNIVKSRQSSDDTTQSLYMMCRSHASILSIIVFFIWVFSTLPVSAQYGWNPSPAITPGTITTPTADQIVPLNFQMTFQTTIAYDKDTRQGFPPSQVDDYFTNANAYAWSAKDSGGYDYGTFTSGYIGQSVTYVAPSIPKILTVKCYYHDDAPPVSPPPSSRDDTDGVSTQTLKVVSVNISADTYYYGGSLIADVEDPTEESVPGRLVAINEDCNSGGVQAHFTDNSMAPDQAYLAQIGLVYGPSTGINGCKIKLEITDGASRIRLWKRSQLMGSCNGTQVTGGTYVIGSDVIPNPMYLEGIEEGNVMLEAAFMRPDETEVMRDKVRIKVVNVFDIDSNTKSIIKGIGLDVSEQHGAGTATSVNIHPNGLTWRPFSLSIPAAVSPNSIPDFVYCLYKPTIEPTANQSLIVGELTADKKLTGIFGVLKDFNTGDTDIRLRVCAGVPLPDGSITRGLIAEKTLHLDISSANVDPGTPSDSLESDASGPFRRVMTEFGNYNGMVCNISLPDTDPLSCNIVSDILSRDSAYIYVRGDTKNPLNNDSDFNAELGLQMGHTNNPGWWPYGRAKTNTLLECDDPPMDWYSGDVSIDYRTTGHPLETSIGINDLVIYLNGQRHHLTDSRWIGNKQKLIGRVTSIGQKVPSGSAMNGPLSINNRRGLYTSGSFLSGVHWQDCKIYTTSTTPQDWTYAYFTDTIAGSYPSFPWINAYDGANGGASDSVNAIYTLTTAP